MLALFRRFLNTWAARLFFLVLVGSFAMWGIADVFRNGGNDSSVATVDGRRIEPPEFQEAYQRALARVTRMFGGRMDSTPQIKRAVAEQTLDRLITQAAVQQQARDLGVTVPDEALRQAIFSMPAFQAATGFSRPQFEAVLRNNGLTEGRFLELMRTELMQQQLLGSVRSGTAAPDTLTRQVFAFQQETRVAELVELPLAAADDPAAPSEEDLRRQYENNPRGYSAPEFRRIKAVILAPEILARDVAVTEAEISAYYDQHKAEYINPEKRSVQVLVAQNEAAARTLAAQWTGGADWAAMEANARAAGASSVVLEDAAQPEFPDPGLGRAVFAAPADTVTGPIHGGLGWQVLRVTKVTPGAARTLAEATTDIHDIIARQKAGDLVYERARTVEDALAAGTKLEDLPGDLGLAAVSGTLDTAGNTPTGEPAPLPGSPQLRQALLATAFQMQKGDLPQLTEAPDHSWFAVTVEDTTVPTLKPFEQVADSVREDWLRAARLREQEIVAAKLLAAVKGGQSLDDAATVAGVRTQRTPPIGRAAPPAGVSPQVAEAAFTLKQGEPSMVATPEGYTVLVVAEIKSPDPAADAAGFAQARTALNRSLGDDTELVFAGAVRDGMKVHINRAVLDGFADR